MATGLAVLFGAGGTLVFVTLLLPHAANTNDLAVAIPPALALAVAAYLLRWGDRVSVGMLEATLAVGSILITGCVAFGGDAASAYPLMYVWVALYAGWFFRPWHAAAHVAFTAVLYGSVFLWRDDIPVPQAHLVMAIGTAVVTSGLVAGLMLRLRAQNTDLQAVARMATVAADPGTYAEDVCANVARSTGADVVALLVPGDGDELRVVASAGGAEGLSEIPDLPETLKLVVREGEALELRVAGAGRARCAGLAQPIVRDSGPGGVLVVAWRKPRRSLPERSARVVSLYAGQAAFGIERLERMARDRERRAMELNDRIVQGLVITKYALERHDDERARQALDGTLEQARRLVTDSLDEVVQAGREIAPGDLVIKPRDD